MSPKQKTMSDICDILHAEAQTQGMGLDREMFSKRHMRMKHEFLIAALENLKKDQTRKDNSDDTP